MTIDELPPELNVPAAWRGPDLASNRGAWIDVLSDAEIAELESATERFIAAGTEIGDIRPQSFPLPTLGPKLAELRATLIHGIGFRLLRGLPVERYSAVETAVIFCGMGAHLGSLRSQNAQGHVLGHVRDTGADPQDFKTRIYQTNKRQSFHTDSSDAVGLLCLKDAMEGGESLLASSVAIFNEMRSKCPDLLRLLFDPIATDRRGEVPEGQKPYFMLPVYSWHEGWLTSIYHRDYIDSAQRFDDAPRLSDKHIEALDAHDELANSPDFHVAMHLEPGDMQFVYNHALLHDRTAFRDWPDPNDRRHLLRLWISLPGDRPLPESFAQRYGTTAVGDRGGIILKETKLNVPLD